MSKGSGATRGLTAAQRNIIATNNRAFSEPILASDSVAAREGLKFSDFNKEPQKGEYRNRRGEIMGTSESYAYVKDSDTGPTRFEINIDRMGPLGTTETVITAQFENSIGRRWSPRQIIARLSEDEMRDKTSQEIIQAILKKRYNPE